MELQSEIVIELRELSPYLAALPRNHPFTTPENYFEGLEYQIMRSVTGENIESAQGEALHEVNHPFEVPDGYFDELPSKITSLIKQQESKEITPKVVPLRRYFAPAKVWLAAAAVALLLTTTFLLWNQQLLTDPSAQRAAIETGADVYDHESELQNAVGIDEGMVVELLLEDQLAGGYSASEEDYYDPSLIDVSDIDDELIDEI